MLTPEEIQSREFLVSLRGYDRDEVHAFLGRVAEQLAQAEAKAAQLQQRLDRLKAQQPAAASRAEPAPSAHQAAGTVEPSAMFAEIGKETQRILEAAQEAGQQIQRKARQEADRDLQAARGQSAKLIAEGERRREHIERIVSELEQARAAMSVQLRGLGRTIEQTLRELAPSDGTTTIRESIEADASRASGRASAAAKATALPAETADVDEQSQQAAPDRAGAAASTPVSTPAPEAEGAAPQQPLTGDGAEPQSDELSSPVSAAPAPAFTADSAGDVAPGAPVMGPDDTEAPAAPAPPAAEATGADETTSQEPATATEPAMPPASDSASANGREDPQALRASALSPLHPRLVRKVKRELQEIQNIALDRLRRSRGQGEVDDFVPGSDDAQGLGEGAAELLGQAWSAGVAAAAVLADRDLGDPAASPDLVGDFNGDASERVRSGLAATLRMGLSAGEGQQALTDRVGAVFAELKGAQAEELAATHLIRAYEHGLLSAWAGGDVRARRWVLGREPRCPEGRCRYNDQGGPVAVGESFASGHDVPPVHVGCTCTTVPAEE